MYAVPPAPILSSAKRINETRGVINWIPLTRDEARGLLTSLEIAYAPATELGCPPNFATNSNDSETMLVTGNLFEKDTATITGLQGNLEYCVAIQVSTSEGDSGFSNTIKLTRKTKFTITYLATINIWPCTSAISTLKKARSSK